MTKHSRVCLWRHFSFKPPDHNNCDYIASNSKKLSLGTPCFIIFFVSIRVLSSVRASSCCSWSTEDRHHLLPHGCPFLPISTFYISWQMDPCGSLSETWLGGRCSALHRMSLSVQIFLRTFEPLIFHHEPWFWTFYYSTWPVAFPTNLRPILATPLCALLCFLQGIKSCTNRKCFYTKKFFFIEISVLTSFGFYTLLSSTGTCCPSLLGLRHVVHVLPC